MKTNQFVPSPSHFQIEEENLRRVDEVYRGEWETDLEIVFSGPESCFSAGSTSFWEVSVCVQRQTSWVHKVLLFVFSFEMNICDYRNPAYLSMRKRVIEKYRKNKKSKSQIPTFRWFSNESEKSINCNSTNSIAFISINQNIMSNFVFCLFVEHCHVIS